MFFKIGVLINFPIFTRKYVSWSIFLIKLQAWCVFLWISQNVWQQQFLWSSFGACFWKQENSADSYLCFLLALLHSVSYFFFLYWSPSLSLCMVFDSVFSNIDEILSINLSANVSVFGDVTSIIRTGSAILVELVDLVNCYNFSISNDLTQIINFRTPIPDCDSQLCSFGFIYFFWH